MKRKSLLFIGILIVLCSMAGVVSAEPKLVDGYYQITNVSDLQWFSTQVNAGHTTYNATLTADIELERVSFTSIGTSSRLYVGTFDGDGYSIKNLSYTSSVKQGIFCYCGAGAIITKINFERALIQTTSGGWSALIKSTGAITVSQCMFDIYNTANSYSFGVCNIAGASLITDCILNSSFNILGTTYYSSICSTGDTTGNQIIQNVYTTGKITCPSSGRTTVGATSGISAMMSSGGQSKYATISSCVCLLENINASVSSNTNSGGRIAGYGTYSEQVTRINKAISNCYASSTCTIDGKTVTQYTATNDVNGANVDASVYNQQNFWDGTGGYLSWDFDNTWYWDSSVNLPKLRCFFHITSLTLTTPSEIIPQNYINATVTVNAYTTATYQWYTTSNTSSTWSIVAGQTSSTLSYTTAPIGDNYYKVIVTLGTQSLDSTTEGFSPLYVLVVSNAPIINSITKTYPLSSDMALGDTLTAHVNATIYREATITYQWYINDGVTATYSAIYSATYPISVSNGSYGTTSGYLYKLALSGSTMGYFSEVLGFVEIPSASYETLFTSSLYPNAILHRSGMTVMGANAYVGAEFDFTTWELKSGWDIEDRLYSTQVETLEMFSLEWTPIIGQTTADLTYTPSTIETNYFKVIVTGNGKSTDSTSVFSPLSITTFNGITDNIISSSSDWAIWKSHYQYYSYVNLTLATDLTSPSNIPIYSAVFNGNNHTISKLTSSLITTLNNATIENLKLQDSIVSGGVLSTTTKSSDVYNVHVSNSFVNGTIAGGLTSSASDSTISYCSSTLCTITSTNSSGGIAGTISNSLITHSNTAKCDILSDGYTYGISP